MASAAQKNYGINMVQTRKLCAVLERTRLSGRGFSSHFVFYTIKNSEKNKYTLAISMRTFPAARQYFTFRTEKNASPTV